MPSTILRTASFKFSQIREAASLILFHIADRFDLKPSISPVTKSMSKRIGPRITFLINSQAELAVDFILSQTEESISVNVSQTLVNVSLTLSHTSEKNSAIGANISLIISTDSFHCSISESHTPVNKIGRASCRERVQR